LLGLRMRNMMSLEKYNRNPTNASNWIN